MSVGQWATGLLIGLFTTAMGMHGLHLRQRTNLTKKEIRTHDTGYIFGAKFFFVSGLITSAVSGIGLVVKVLILIVKALTS